MKPHNDLLWHLWLTNGNARCNSHKKDWCLSPGLTQAGRTVHMQKHYENIYAHKHMHMSYVWHRDKPIVVSAHRVLELAEKRREREDCIFRPCCGVGRGMQCFSGVGGVSDRAVMWGSCVGHTPHWNYKAPNLRVWVRWTCLHYASLHAAETMCSVQKYGILCLAWTTFPREALFCVEMATIQQNILKIAKPQLAYFTVVYIPSPLTTNSAECCKMCVFIHNLL